MTRLTEVRHNEILLVWAKHKSGQKTTLNGWATLIQGVDLMFDITEGLIICQCMWSLLFCPGLGIWLMSGNYPSGHPPLSLQIFWSVTTLHSAALLPRGAAHVTGQSPRRSSTEEWWSKTPPYLIKPDCQISATEQGFLSQVSDAGSVLTAPVTQSNESC